MNSLWAKEPKLNRISWKELVTGLCGYYDPKSTRKEATFCKGGYLYNLKRVGKLVEITRGIL